ncbi:hypothetical protein BO86DRAFT_139417 [Aspergillus japonicus CBS 114.51]|uniref:Uncharacterized protein n=1 Tax=Aspergillus japonicus CBS 114.51 TaxID=1448312 RepID=A0A8T8XDJ3_ASPJA|nr:hypothetical protein BO86DRAFT_139417 [Aspergillus japonicus CBS 114.51]RAH86100.1 hypothetical protein BO86DRAFT_139417 [Aspergillus japonicus CBS 114.51]
MVPVMTIFLDCRPLSDHSNIYFPLLIKTSSAFFILPGPILIRLLKSFYCN